MQVVKAKQGTAAVQDESWLQVQGMPALENAQLDNVHVSVTVPDHPVCRSYRADGP